MAAQQAASYPQGESRSGTGPLNEHPHLSPYGGNGANATSVELPLMRSDAQQQGINRPVMTSNFGPTPQGEGLDFPPKPTYMPNNYMPGEY